MSCKDDKRRYLIIGSVILEVVTPLIRQRLENLYQQHFGSLQDFLNSQTVKHILFHLRHRNNWCCSDKRKCINGNRPLYHGQWDLLYAENPGQIAHNCYCKYTAKNVKLDDLDFTLVSLIVLNCCKQSPADEHAIRKLRQFKNELFSHNTTGGIKKAEYDSHWGDIMTFVLQLDPSKHDDLIRLEHRPLDDLLCTKYFTILLDICEVIERIGLSIQQFHDMFQRSNDLNVENNRLLQLIWLHLSEDRTHQTDLQSTVPEEKSVTLVIDCKNLSADQTNQTGSDRSLLKGHNSNQVLELGKDIFTVEKTLTLRGVVQGVLNVLLIDSRYIVLCGFISKSLIIINIDDLQKQIIPLPDHPVKLSSINSSLIAVAYYRNRYIDVYDINIKTKTKSISLKKIVLDFTTMKDKLVVIVDCSFHIIDYQTGDVIRTIDLGEYYPYSIHAFGDIIYFTSIFGCYLYCYNDCKRITTKLELQSVPLSMTSLDDGSLYVICANHNGDFDTLLHVSPDCMKYKRVKRPELELFCLPHRNYTVCFNRLLRKMVICDGHNVYVLNEK